MAEQNLIEGFTPEQLRAMLKQATEAQNRVQEAFAKRLSDVGEDFLTTVVTDTDEETSDTSAWVGHSARGLSVVVDGQAYTATVTLTHTARTDERKPIVTAAKAAAKAAGLSADDTKKFVKQALDMHEAGTLIEA